MRIGPARASQPQAVARLQHRIRAASSRPAARDRQRPIMAAAALIKLPVMRAAPLGSRACAASASKLRAMASSSSSSPAAPASRRTLLLAADESEVSASPRRAPPLLLPSHRHTPPHPAPPRAGLHLCVRLGCAEPVPAG
jgi:hypothetical protein